MEITITNLNKIYNQHIKALHNVSLHIPAGMFGLLGQNGAGKTTLMRILATLLPPSSGDITIGSYHLNNSQDKWKIRASLGYLPQDLQLYEELSAAEFLHYMATLKKVNLQNIRHDIQHLLDITSLTEVAQRRIKTYSGGMKRRVGIAQALLGNPSLLIVDEPTAGLDPQERVRFRQILVQLSATKTILMSSHVIEDIAHTCQQMAILHKGQVVFTGSLTNLLQDVQGKVWEVELAGPTVFQQVLLVNALRTETGMRYRLLSEEAPHPQAQSVSPVIEDGYLWLTQERP